MTIRDLLNKDMGAAIDWLLRNRDVYDLVRREQHQTAEVSPSKSTELLVVLNDLVDTVRNLQYEAEGKDDNCSGELYKGLSDAYEDCAERLTEIVKDH